MRHFTAAPEFQLWLNLACLLQTNRQLWRE